MIRLVLTYFENQQSFKDNVKQILKHEFDYNTTSSSHRWRLSFYVKRTRVPGVNFLTQNRQKIVEVDDNLVMHQETKRD